MTEQADSPGWGALDSLPGNPLMWVLIISELLVFGAFFTAFSAAEAFHPALFAASQAQLDRVAGGINTMLLLSSGLAAAMALKARSDRKIGRCRIWLAGAATLGTAFLVVKGVEYAHHAAQGITLETNDFFTLFYLMTGFHALHVVLGLVLLAVAGWKCSIENVETGTAFWHMVDLIWVLLYPILYLIR
jgi:nitric oxide reductase NorE protein